MDAPGRAPPNTATSPSEEELAGLDAHWRACNYLAAGMIYLQALLREPLKPECR